MPSYSNAEFQQMLQQARNKQPGGGSGMSNQPAKNRWSVVKQTDEPESFFGKAAKGTMDFLGGMARDIVKPLASTAIQMPRAFMAGISGLSGDTAGEAAWSKPVDVPLLGQVKGLSANPEDVKKYGTQTAEETAGQAVSIASNLVGGEGASGVAESVGKKTIGTLAREGAGVGFKAGVLGGAGSAMGQDKGAYDVAGGAISGGLTGSAVGGAFGAASPYLEKAGGALWESVFGKSPLIEDVAGKAGIPPEGQTGTSGATPKEIVPPPKEIVPPSKVTVPIDPAALKLAKGKLTPDFIKLVQDASPEDVAAMKDMVASGEEFSGDKMAQDPSIHHGKALVEQMKPIQAKNAAAGKALGASVKRLGERPVSVMKPTLDFLDSLKEMNINVGEDGKLDFSNSTLQGSQGGDSRTMLQDAYDKLNKTEGSMTAGEIQAYKQSLGADLGLGSGKQVIDSQAKIKLEGLRRSLGDAIGAVSPSYRRANTTYAVTKDAIDSFEKEMGAKFADVSPAVLERRAADVSRRLAGNASAPQLKLADDIAAAHSAIGFKPKTNIQRQVLFESALHSLFDLVKPNGLAGQAKEAVAGAIQEHGAAMMEAATGNPLGAAVKTGFKLFNKGPSKEAGIKALKALLGM